MWKRVNGKKENPPPEKRRISYEKESCILYTEFCLSGRVTSPKASAIPLSDDLEYGRAGTALLETRKRQTSKIDFRKWTMGYYLLSIFAVCRSRHLAPDGVYLALVITDEAVGSYPTISPLPCYRRFILCGTFRHQIQSHAYELIPMPWLSPGILPMEFGLSSLNGVSK